MSNNRIVSHAEYAKIMKETLLKRFKECMSRQFSERIASHGGLTDVELRNVARTFAMGWAEALGASGNSVATYCWALAFGDITTEHWWPGDEWKFW